MEEKKMPLGAMSPDQLAHTLDKINLELAKRKHGHKITPEALKRSGVTSVLTNPPK